MTNKEVRQKKLIAFIGEDQDFINEMNIRFRQIGIDADYCQKSYYPGVLIDISAENFPNVIILEITNSTKDITAEEVLFLKKVPVFKPIMVIAIFPDKESLEKHPTLASCGVSFFYIKGCEYEHLFRDCLLYGLETKIISPAFAKANGLKLKKDLNAISSITGIDSSELYLDTDAGMPWATSISLDLNFLNDKQFRDYEVIEHNTFSTIYPMTDRYLLKFSYVGPWDEESEEALKAETVRDFIDNYPFFDKRKDFIWIFTDIKWPEELFLYSLNCPFHIEYKSLNHIKSLCDFEWKKPLGIFIEVKDDSEEEHSQIIELVDIVRRIQSYQPIIFILNSHFSSHDMKVKNNYENIISSSKELEFDFLTKVISTLADSNKANTDNEFRYFKKDDINRCLNFKLESTITSLTEHEVEFELATEIPLFSLLQIKLPENIFITIVDIENKGDNRFLYTGILHGMDEFAYQNLRKIINQLIYNPKNELSSEDIQKILYSPQAKIEQTAAVIKSVTEEDSILDYNKANRDRAFSRSSKYPKSKL